MAAVSLARYQWAFPWSNGDKVLDGLPWVRAYSGQGGDPLVNLHDCVHKLTVGVEKCHRPHCLWLREARKSGELARRLAGMGALDALRYSREVGCEWDASACTAAAENGQLEALRWLRSQGAHLEGAAAVVCRSCQYETGDVPEDDAGRTALITATEFVMEKFPDCQWEDDENDDMVGWIHPPGSVPFYSHYGGHPRAAQLRAQLVRVRHTPEMRRRILVDRRQAEQNTPFPPFQLSPACCRTCQVKTTAFVHILLGCVHTLMALSPEPHRLPVHSSRRRRRAGGPWRQLLRPARAKFGRVGRGDSEPAVPAGVGVARVPHVSDRDSRGAVRVFQKPGAERCKGGTGGLFRGHFQ